MTFASGSVELTMVRHNMKIVGLGFYSGFFYLEGDKW